MEQNMTGVPIRCERLRLPTRQPRPVRLLPPMVMR
jgi:hypothetical protein